MIRLELRGEPAGSRVGLVTIDRHQRRNALDTASLVELDAAFSSAVEQGARCVVLAGAEGNFCAGADLGTVRDPDFGPALRKLLRGITARPVVCIAAVAGAALGLGVQLAVACDLRMAEPDARFGVPAARLGLMVDHWTVRRVAAVAGGGVARALLLGAMQVDGTEARAAGLVQRLGGLEDALAWAGELAELAPLTLAGHKLALNRLEPDLEDPEVAAAFERAWSSEDLSEGVAAFRERRTPRFRGA